MATAAQIAANQANARLSTGPRTPEGKSRCAHNAVRHGLTARHLIVREDEREEFECLRDSLYAELAPQGPVEQITFDELLHAGWNLRRFRRLEAEAASEAADPLNDPKFDAFLDRLARYQARAQRAWYRALKELRTLQTNRALRLMKLDEDIEPEIPAIADINELTKQSRSEVKAEGIKYATGLLDYECSLMRRHGIDPIVVSHRAEFNKSKPIASASGARNTNGSPEMPAQFRK